MEEMERDFIEFEDEDGNSFKLDIIDYFEHDDEQYAILMDLESIDDEDEGDEPLEQEVYILKVVTDGEYEEFMDPAEDKMDALIAKADAILNSCCDHEHDDCDCGCEHDGCGCEKKD